MRLIKSITTILIFIHGSCENGKYLNGFTGFIFLKTKHIIIYLNIRVPIFFFSQLKLAVILKRSIGAHFYFI